MKNHDDEEREKREEHERKQRKASECYKAELRMRKESRQWVNCVRPLGTDSQEVKLTEQCLLFLKMGFNTGEVIIHKDNEGVCEVLPAYCFRELMEG